MCACLWILNFLFIDLKRGIPHWCSYSSKQQYLSASIAGFLWCDKSIACCVELQDSHAFLLKNALLRKAKFARAAPHSSHPTPYPKPSRPLTLQHLDLNLCLDKLTYILGNYIVKRKYRILQWIFFLSLFSQKWIFEFYWNIILLTV